MSSIKETGRNKFGLQKLSNSLSIPFYIKLLAIIGLPMLFVNLYVNGYLAIIEILNGNTALLYRDFEVYIRTVKFFFDDPTNLYWIPDWMGDNWFIYPPLSIFLFIPFGILPEPWNLITWRIINIAIYFISIKLILSIFKDKFKFDFSNLNFYIYLIAFSLGSFYLNINHGQINIVLLFLGVLTLYYLVKNKVIKSNIFFSLGIWMKLYPATLFPVFLKDKRTIKITLISLFVYFFILPLILSPIIPLEIYRYFFFEFVPYFINLPHDMSPCNQSLMCFLMHFYIPVETFGEYPRFEIFDWIRITNSILFIISLITIFILYFREKESNMLWAFCSLMALSPVFSITGWEAVYILALPLIILVLYQVRNKKKIAQIIIILSVILMYLPKPPSGLIAEYTNTIPFIFQMLFFFRYMYITLFMIIISYYWNKRQESDILN